MSVYIDDGEKFVARLGGEYAPGAKKAAKSLELTDRRIYFSTVGISARKNGKGENMMSSVIDAANVSAVTYAYEKPRGRFGLGIFLLAIAAIAGIVFGVVGYVGDETKAIIKLILPVCLGVGAGIIALAACYLVTYFVRKSRRAVTVSIEYRGLILRTDFYGISDEKLEEFRRWTFRVKDKLVGRKAPPLPDNVTKAGFAEPKADMQKDTKETKKTAKTEQSAAYGQKTAAEAETVEEVIPIKVEKVIK